MTTENRRAPRPPGMFTGKPSLKEAAKAVAMAPFKFLGGATEKVIAPIALAPYQLATDKVVEDKIRDFSKTYSHDMQTRDGKPVTVDHDLDFAGSNLNRKFSLKGGPHFVNEYNVKLDHGVRLDLPRPSPDPGYEVEQPIQQPI